MAVYRIPIELRNGSFPSPMANVWHGRADSSGAIFDPAQAAGTMLGELQTFYGQCVQMLAAGTTVHFPTEIVDVDTKEETPIQPINPIAATATTIAPKGLSICISWRTSLRARRGRGRTFLGPLSGNFLENSTGAPYAGFRSALQTAVDDLLEASSGVNGWALGVYGQEQPLVDTAHVLRDFTQGVVSDEFTLLRSRRD